MGHIAPVGFVAQVGAELVQLTDGGFSSHLQARNVIHKQPQTRPCEPFT